MSRCASFLGILFVAAFCSRAEEPAYLDPHLEPFRNLLGKTFRGEFKDSKPEKPLVDVSRWERALNGKAVRMLHSLNDGAYGGETLFVWNEEAQVVKYFYFTTAGFMTTGTVAFKDGKILTHENVAGAANGVTEVRGVSEISTAGTLQVKTEYLKNGDWVPGREVTYREYAAGKVVFK
jgi:hypothetical protein